MPQLLVRDINPVTLDSLKNRAKLHHRSLQGEVRCILEKAANTSFEKPSWSPSVLKQIVGKWEGEPLTRPTQADYDKRETFE